MSNLIKIDCSNILIDNSVNLKVIYLNSRSCRNKTTEINDLIIEKNADLVFISETWLKDNDCTITKNLVPPSYSIVSRNRKSRTGGGVAIIYRTSFTVLSTSYVRNDFSSFESCHIKIKTLDSKTCFFTCIYRPPKSAKNKVPFSTFISEFNELCEDLSNEQYLYMFGDFNIDFKNSAGKNVCDFKSLIYEHDLTQCIDEKTHISGHVLDLCLYRCLTDAFIELPVVDDICISDHFVITATLPFSKPKQIKDTIKVRNIKILI